MTNNNFEVLLNGTTVFTTENIGVYKHYLKTNALVLTSSTGYTFIDPTAKNSAENVDIDDTDTELVNIEGLTIEEAHYLIDQEAAENTNSLLPVSDEYHRYNGFIGYGDRENMKNYWY